MDAQKRLPLYKRIFPNSHPSAFLLAMQALQLFLYAAFADIYSGRALISVFGMLVLVLVVWVINHSPAVGWLAWSLTIPTFILVLLSVLIVDDTLLAWSSLLEGLLYFYAAGSLIAYMLGDNQVTVDELFAAGATFTLFAWGFAYLFLTIETWYPGSFHHVLVAGEALTFIDLLFMSFTTLSSGSLSDLLPATTLAKVLLMMEQFVGVGFVAVVVSRLVGLTIQKQIHRHD